MKQNCVLMEDIVIEANKRACLVLSYVVGSQYCKAVAHTLHHPH